MSDYPWTDSQVLVDWIAKEALLKRGWGYPKLEFSIPINWIDEFDIFSNFRFQDPFGLSLTGTGERARHYYIESITADFMGQKLDIVAVDFTFLLSQYSVKGDETVLAANWATAPPADRMYLYACDETTGLFADGELGKVKIDENILP